MGGKSNHHVRLPAPSGCDQRADAPSAGDRGRCPSPTDPQDIGRSRGGDPRQQPVREELQRRRLSNKSWSEYRPARAGRTSASTSGRPPTATARDDPPCALWQPFRTRYGSGAQPAPIRCSIIDVSASSQDATGSPLQATLRHHGETRPACRARQRPSLTPQPAGPARWQPPAIGDRLSCEQGFSARPPAAAGRFGVHARFPQGEAPLGRGYR